MAKKKAAKKKVAKKKVAKKKVSKKKPGKGVVLSNLSTETHNFVCNIDGLKISLPIVAQSLEKEVSRVENKMIEFMKRGIVNFKEESHTMEITPSDYYRFMSLNREYRQTKVGETIIPASFVVALVSQLDHFLGRLLRYVYTNRPEMLKASEKELTFQQLFDIGSIQNAKEYLLEKEIESLLRESHSEQMKWLEKKFKIPVVEVQNSWKAFIELTQRRNVIVHCNGIVSSQYIAVCKQHKVPLSKKTQVGTGLPVTIEYFNNGVNCIFEIGIKMSQLLWRKLLPSDSVKQSECLSEIVYDLIVEERYELAVTLLDFACSKWIRHPDDLMRRRFIINRAQVYKWAGDDSTCQKVITAEDWTSCTEDFKIAVAVLSGDFERVAKIMRQVGKDGSNNEGKVPEHAYVEWPLFKEFRKSAVFKKAFSDIFGHPYVSVDRTAELMAIEKKASRRKE